MHLTLPAVVVDHLPRLSGGAIKTYVALSLIKAGGTTEYPTQYSIAEQINASPRSVLTYLKELEQAGYIEKRRIGAGRRTDYVLVNAPRYGA